MVYLYLLARAAVLKVWPTDERRSAELWSKFMYNLYKCIISNVFQLKSVITDNNYLVKHYMCFCHRFKKTKLIDIPLFFAIL